MPNITISPGSGPLPGATESQAAENVAAFTAELGGVTSFVRAASSDYGRGRYAFEILTADGRRIEIQMPGTALEHLREGAFRLYVDGSSWSWDFALKRCAAQD